MAIINTASLKTGVHVSFQIVVFSRSEPRMRLPDPMAPLCLLFSGASMQFSIVAAPLCIPTQGVGGLHFPHVLCSIYSLEIFLVMAILTSGRGVLSVDFICIDLIMSVSSLMWLSSKESACSAGDARDLDLIPEWGRSPGEGNGNPFQYSCLDNPMDR